MNDPEKEINISSEKKELFDYQANKAQAWLQKLLKKPVPFTCHPRVIRWRRHLFGVPLPDAEFPEYANKSSSYQMFMHACHRLTGSICDQLYAMGLKCSWFNEGTNTQDTLMIIPAELSLPGQGCFRGILGYCIDSKNVLYHLYFKKMLDRDITKKIITQSFQFEDLADKEEVDSFFGQDQKILKSFSQVDFPSWETAQAKFKQKQINPIIVKMNERIIIDLLFGTIEIEDLQTRISLKLYPTNPFTI